MRNYIFLGIAVVIITALLVTLYVVNQKGGQELVVHAIRTGQLSPAPAAATIISFTLDKTKNGTVLIIAWKNLPNGTKELVVWRAPSGTKAWTIWKTLRVTSETEASGNAAINIGKLDVTKYQFSLQAVGNSTVGNGTTTQVVLWTSPVIEATTTASSTIAFISNSTSTPNLPPLPKTLPPPSNLPNPTSTTTIANNPPPPTTSTSTQQLTTITIQSPAPTSSQPTQNSGTNTNPATYYYTYTPQQAPSAQAAPQKGSFWVQYVNQAIEIGWQNLPGTTEKIVISRSPNQNGPWTVVLTQENPDPTGPYSIKLVDDTLNTPYYYKLGTYTNGTLTQTYGPVYLEPI